MTTDSDVQFMTRDQLKAEVLRLRVGIRSHRDQRLDDRCWMDDIELYDLLPEKADPNFVDLRQLPKETMMHNCDLFTTCRRTELSPEEAVAAYRRKLTDIDGHVIIG